MIRAIGTWRQRLRAWWRTAFRKPQAHPTSYDPLVERPAEPALWVSKRVVAVPLAYMNIPGYPLARIVCRMYPDHAGHRVNGFQFTMAHCWVFKCECGQSFIVTESDVAAAPREVYHGPSAAQNG